MALASKAVTPAPETKCLRTAGPKAASVTRSPGTQRKVFVEEEVEVEEEDDEEEEVPSR